MRRSRFLFWFTVAAAGWAGTSAAVRVQEWPAAPSPQTPVFRGAAETVLVYASVLDRYGEMVLNLERDDFQVEDDGRPQPLTVFESGLEPITAVLLLDTSASMTLNLEFARAAAEQFIIRMLPGDQARVGTFSDRVTLSDRFTGDRDALLRSFNDDLQFGNPTRLWDAVDRTFTVLAPLSGRRVVMLLTDGIDTMSTAREADVLARARAEELMVYVVQFRSSRRASLAELPLAPSASTVFSGDQSRRAPRPTAGLIELADATGGGHFLLGALDDVNATFTHVMQELHYQYVLGFTPARLDGKVHDIRVSARRPNMTVRARRHYVAGRPPGE
jgi:Ca-activated chloride channel family protein